jgi:hypothetical protein
MLANLVWRATLLGAVFVTDLVVFIDLCRQELRDWRAGQRSQSGGQSDYTVQRAARR